MKNSNDWKTYNVPKSTVQRIKYINLCAKSISENIIKFNKQSNQPPRKWNLPNTNVTAPSRRKKFHNNNLTFSFQIFHKDVINHCIICSEPIKNIDHFYCWNTISLTPFIYICKDCLNF